MNSDSGSTTESDAESRLRVLLVDDHADTLASLRMLLEHRGFAVTTASNGATAIELAAKGRFDVLISDIGLPDSSGYEVVAAVHRLQHIPAIAFSGYGTEGDVERSYVAGFARHFTKPVMVSRLVDAIFELVGMQDDLR
jgi:CheY-like chemotaxis protein